MNRLGLVLLIASLPWLACGSLDVGAVDASETTAIASVAALEDLGVCGPIHEVAATTPSYHNVA